ncbi:hypothetical protein I3271_09200 [Photobacterium leiognathi]|uniref:hypothetical protein n=1 Tax=Photobacterium leiognathi TaxID=553611 RepID=UPI001EDD50A4|nr:hypothetical protein [Photobacterium leiognathi]MCG3884865.1 hypothetical protein [Photobacterium leiognathi]
MLDAILHLPLLLFIFYAPIFIYGTKIKKLEKIKTTTTKSSVAYGVLLLLNIFALFLINILFGFGYLNTGKLRGLLLLLF